MKLRRILRSESFRLTATFVALFALVAIVMAATLIWTMERTERRVLAQAIDADIRTIRNGFDDKGLGEAIEIVEQRLGHNGEFHGRAQNSDYLLLQDRAGRVLAGNLPALAPVTEPGQGPAGGPGGRHGRQMLGRSQLLPDGSYLYVGRDLGPVYALRQDILRAFGWIALGTIALAILAGAYFSVLFLRRIDAMATTCGAIIAGRLSDRIPLRGSGDELDRLSGTINQMLDRIAALMENLHQVSSDIAHDLRTPLTHLRQRLESASARARSTGEFRQAVDDAIRDTDELLRIFHALLRISQIDSGQRTASFTTVDLSELLQRVVAIYGPLAEDEAHVLEAEIAPHLAVHGDAELLLQTWVNLVENALRHTPAGTRIVMRARAVPAGVSIELADDGPGIPADERAKVLRRFHRLARDRNTPGNGLGLSLVDAVIGLHQGRIELLDNSPGLRIRIELPAAPARDALE